MIKSARSGFTLIELLVVIAVVGVLAGAIVIMVNPDAQFKRARNAQRRNDLRAIANAVERYAAIMGSYPSTAGSWCRTGLLQPGYDYCASNRTFGLVPGELKKIPEDPKTGQVNSVYQAGVGCEGTGNNGYLYRSDGINYKIIAHCTPEGSSLAEIYQVSDPYYDPSRPTWAWQISTPGGLNW